MGFVVVAEFDPGRIAMREVEVVGEAVFHVPVRLTGKNNSVHVADIKSPFIQAIADSLGWQTPRRVLNACKAFLFRSRHYLSIYYQRRRRIPVANSNAATDSKDVHDARLTDRTRMC
jgi:hypothetical protein